MKSVYQQRRQRVLETLGPGVLIVPSQSRALRNNDVEHEFRQDSDFFYLTGFEEPESIAVLSTAPEEKTTLFLRDRDPERERWDGDRLGCGAACEALGVDAAYSGSEFEERLADLLLGHECLYFELGRQSWL